MVVIFVGVELFRGHGGRVRLGAALEELPRRMGRRQVSGHLRFRRSNSSSGRVHAKNELAACKTLGSRYICILYVILCAFYSYIVEQGEQTQPEADIYNYIK